MDDAMDRAKGEALDEADARFQRTLLASGTVLAGRYRVKELIGEGGMGDVYLAEHLKIDKAVAIKVLAPEQMRRAKTVTRFLQEAKAASKIRHENIVDITDYGEAESCAFFVMEYLEGEDLSVILKRESKMSWERARRITVQLLEALAAAHKAGIVHRDIKPHNCFITPREHTPDFVKVIDFGIAKLRIDGSEEQLTRTGAIMGTAEYMSPEQGQGADIDGRSDLYSVGVILYRMLTGSVPFTGSNPMGVLYQHIHGKLVPPSEAAPDAEIPPDLDALIVRSLAKDRDKRFENAEAFIAAIHDIGKAVAPVAKPRPWLPLAAVGVAVVVALVWGWSSFLTDGPAPRTVAASTTPADPPPTAESAPEPRPAPAPEPRPAPAPEPEVEPDPESEPPAADPDGSPAILTAPPERRPKRKIRVALSRVGGQVKACSKKAGLFPGETVVVQLKIAPSGRISSVQAKGAHSAAGTACIEKAVRRARLGPAQRAQNYRHEYKI